MYTTTLLKGPKGQRVWEDSTGLRAVLRRSALIELHSLRPDDISEEVNSDRFMTLDASRYYTPRRRHK